MAEGVKGFSIAINRYISPLLRIATPLKTSLNGLCPRIGHFCSKPVQIRPKRIRFDSKPVPRAGGHQSFEGIS
jgi:hypothetical protein